MHSFNPATDGCGPIGNLTRTADGSFVGATIFGGYPGTQVFGGTVFKITPSGTFTSLYMFPVGTGPRNSPIEGPGGSLYGTTETNAGNEGGTIYKLTRQGGTWQPTLLHAFTGPDGSYPYAGLALGADDNLYGVTSSGGANFGGTLFRISSFAAPNSPVETLHTFSSDPNDGFVPLGRLLQPSPGVFVGTTMGGNGTAIGGSIFTWRLPSRSDTTQPQITNASASPAILWPPNHKMVPVTVRVIVTDNADPSPICRITAVSSNEPIDGLGDGDMSPDWSTPGGLSVDLRAERSGNGAGRVYTLAIQCRDASGNSAATITEVRVPKSSGQ